MTRRLIKNKTSGTFHTHTLTLSKSTSVEGDSIHEVSSADWAYDSRTTVSRAAVARGLRYGIATAAPRRSSYPPYNETKQLNMF